MHATSSSSGSLCRSHFVGGTAGLWLTLALLPLALYFTSLALFPASRVAESLTYPYQLDAEEGFLLGQSLRLTSGEGMYLPIAKPPYVVDNYPPAYPAIWSVVARWTGPSLAPGRWIVAIASIAIAVAIALIVAASTRSLAMAWLSPLLFLTTYAFLRWVGYARVDLPAIALSIWGLAIFGLWGREKRWAFAASITLFALSLFAKQTAVAAPLACFVWLLIQRDWRRALWFLLSLVLAVGIPTAALCLWTGGQYYLHTVTYNRNVMHWAELLGWSRHIWMLYAPLVIAMPVLCFWEIARVFTGREAGDFPSGVFSQESERETGASLYLIYMAIGALSLLSLAKAGAAENYLLEPFCAAVLFLGVAQGAVLAQLSSLRPGKAELAVAVLVTILLYVHAFRFFINGFEASFFGTAPRPSVADLVQGDRVVREIESRPGPVLCEEPIYALKAGRPILFQHFIMTQLAAEGKWDPTPITQMASRGEFSLIAAHQDLFNENQFFDRYPPSLRKALRERYVLLDHLDRGRLQPIYLYVPRGKTP